MPKYSIIIPVCNNSELTNRCLYSIAQNSEDYEVIVVDNGSNPPFRGPEFSIRNETNLGFPKAVNQGIEKALGEVVVILNNDTVVTPHWLDRLSAHFNNYDMVGAVTNRISGPQQVSMASEGLLESLSEVSEGIYKANAGRSMPFFRLVFFCVAIKRAVIEKIGLLDEQFSPGNFEDDDYCLRAIEAGFRLGFASDCFIFHEGSATHKTLNLDHAELLRVNSAKFSKKWPPEKYALLRKQNILNCSGNVLPKKRSLALVMVVKNEGLGLERAILSVRDFVDEVVIAVDNSSTDNTLEIAKKYATTLKQFDWRDDFAWARNFAHEGVKTDWCFFLDGHEYVEQYPNLETMLSSPADGLLCSVELESGAVIRNPRIYRTGLQFSGAVHEIQNCKTLSSYPDFLIKHGRVGGQSAHAIALRDRQRDEQVPRIMGKQLAENPKNTRAALHLALYYHSHGQLRQALKYQKKYLKYAQAHGERWYMYFNKALCHLGLGHHLRALWACDDAEKETPRRWEIARLRGLIFFQAKQYQRAVKFFVDAFDENKGDVTFKPWKRDDVLVWDHIGRAYFFLRRYDLAGEAFEQACRLCKDEKKRKLFFDRAALMRQILRSS